MEQDKEEGTKKRSNDNELKEEKLIFILYVFGAKRAKVLLIHKLMISLNKQQDGI